MTDEARKELMKQQKALSREWEFWEELQTEFSNDIDFFRFCEWKKQLIDEEAEQIRYVFEVGWAE